MCQLESVGNMLKKKAADPGKVPESDKSTAPPLDKHNGNVQFPGRRS